MFKLYQEQRKQFSPNLAIEGLLKPLIKLNLFLYAALLVLAFVMQAVFRIVKTVLKYRIQLSFTWPLLLVKQTALKVREDYCFY